MEPITLSWFLSHESSPLAYRFMIAAPPQVRKRRISALLANACEVAIRLQRLGGVIRLNGVLNPTEFADPSEDTYNWKGCMVKIQVYYQVSPFLYRAIQGRSENEVKSIVSTALETYLLLLGATTLPSAPASSNTVISMNDGVSTLAEGVGLPAAPSDMSHGYATDHHTQDKSIYESDDHTSAGDASDYSDVRSDQFRTEPESSNAADHSNDADDDDFISNIDSLGKAT